MVDSKSKTLSMNLGPKTSLLPENLGKWNNDAIATHYLFYVTKNEDLKNAIIFGSSAKTLPSFSNAFDPSVLVPFARKRIGVYMKRRVFPPFLNILHHFYHY